MRLLLAAVVVAVHYGMLADVPVRLSPLDAVSVYGFFFLSGYWVCRLWDHKYSKARTPLLTFYCSRALRIYPVSWASVVIASVVSPAVTTGQLFDNLVVVGQRLGPNPLNPPIWSLAIELQFYLLAPVLFVMLRNELITAAILGIGFACWIIFAHFGPYLYVFHFIAWFTFGALFARSQWMQRVIACVGPTSLILLLPLLSVPFWPIRWVDPDVVRFSALALGVIAVPYVAATLLKRSGPADRILGDLAYPIYLLHWPAYILAARVADGGQAVLIALLITAIFTGVVYLIIDRPLEAMRHRFVAAQSARSAMQN